MKKILFSVVCLMMVGIQSVKAQVAIAALHHQGNVTIYAGTYIQNAADAAVQGDTLYLSSGAFPAFNMSNPCVVIGAGEQTVIGGNLVYNYSGGNTSGYAFIGLNITDELRLQDGRVDGLYIDQCTCETITSYAGYLNTTILRCYIKSGMTLYGNKTVENASVIASKMGHVAEYSYGGIEYVNCNINTADGSLNTFTNCNVVTTYKGSYVNCTYYNNNGTTAPTLVNCWKTFGLLTNNYDTSISNEELISNGYIGTDGTVVGITGGSAPYTLELSTPKVTNKTISVDNTHKTLNVNLTVE